MGGGGGGGEYANAYTCRCRSHQQIATQPVASKSKVVKWQKCLPKSWNHGVDE